jgi:predicted phage baseplate assembly protein
MTFSGTIASDFMKLANIPEAKRPTLVNFAATDFLSLRNSLIEYAKAVYPNEYQYFVESDLGMMFIELVSYMGSVMSMKADMLANENFLATATQRPSVKKLLELVGVRLRGPLSAAADGQVTFSWELAGAPATVTFAPNQRTIETTSPEDGGAVTFTLYKVVNGLADIANATGNLVLTTASEGKGANKNVFDNLVLQEGALVTDTGDFASTEAIKSIKLTQGPVIDGSVQVYVNSPTLAANGAYREVDNVYFASGATDRVFEMVYDEDFVGTVVFGDGDAGISPDDTANYVVQYRVGGGSRGNILRDAINTGVTASLGGTTYNGTLTNISKGTGGQNAETIEHAKKYAPLTFRRQDRLVTLEDYSVFANTFIGTFGTVGKATAATRNAYSSANTIDIYVLEKASDIQLQRATTNFKTQLLDAINPKKMATDDVVIVDGLIRTLDLTTTIHIDREEEGNRDKIITKVRNNILNYMNVDNRDFGEDLIIAELNRKIFEVDEVRWSTVDNVGQDVRIDFNEIIQLNNLTINVALID